MKVFKFITAIIAFAGVVGGAYYLVKKHLEGKSCCSCENCDDFCSFDEEEEKEELQQTEEFTEDKTEE